MLTLVDSLDTLIVLREFERFNEALVLLEELSFNRDVEVSVFESNIRVLGGLLSAHQLAIAVNPSLNYSYDGSTLLNHAENLAKRLLPAFETATGVPIHRVNLRTGKIQDEQTTTCPAAGGSFLLEMGLLSRLVGNPIYEEAALKAALGLWQRRSSLDLVGAMIDTNSGKWYV